jgi:hypothetical protein
MHELRYYLETLLDHQCSSGNGDCRECRSLERIYQFMHTELFSTVIYTGITADRRQTSLSQWQSVNRATAGPRRPHAA